VKRSEIMIIAVVALVSVAVAYAIANSFLGSVASNPTSIETVDKFDTSFGEVDKTIFNSDAINPTVQIVIGDGSSADTSTAADNTGTTDTEAE